MNKNEEDKNNMENTTESVKELKTSEVKEKKQERTFTRDELNKIVNAEKQKERKNTLKEIENNNKKKITERLNDMSDIEKIKILLKRLEETQNKMKENELKNKAYKQAEDKGIPIELITTLDFRKETDESITKKLEIFEKITTKNIQK